MRRMKLINGNERLVFSTWNIMRLAKRKMAEMKSGSGTLVGNCHPRWNLVKNQKKDHKPKIYKVDKVFQF